MGGEAQEEQRQKALTQSARREREGRKGERGRFVVDCGYGILAAGWVVGVGGGDGDGGGAGSDGDGGAGL